MFEDADLVSVYTRRQAIEDGVLVPTTDLVPDEDLAKQAGFKWPVALTSTVAAIVEPAEREREFGQDVKGRLWDLLWMMRLGVSRTGGGTEMLFRVSFTMIRDADGRHQVEHAFKLVSGPGDDREPVLTVMLPGES